MSSSSIILSWNEAKDKKVKSSDEKDLGKVYNATKDYIEIKEGRIGKKTYFVPKYFVQGYDGDNIWISLEKEDVKRRFERELPPQDVSEFETPDYVQRRESIRKYFPDFDNNIPRYTPIPGASSADSGSVPTPTSTKMVSVSWGKLKGKKVKSKDNSDIVKVNEVGPHYIEGKEGLIGKKSYFIPKYYIEYFDGDKLQTSLSKDEIKKKWERSSPPTEAEVQTQEYLERKKKVEEEQPQFLHGVPFMAQEPGVSVRSDTTGEEVKIEWAEVIHKHVRAFDDIDVGDFVRSRFERDTEPTSEKIQILAREAKTEAERQNQEVTSTKEKDTSTDKYEEGAPGTETGRRDDPLKEYREKEPMTPAKIKEHEPTAVKREMTERITEPGQTGTDAERAREIARSKGMAKGTAGAAETGDQYE